MCSYFWVRLQLIELGWEVIRLIIKILAESLFKDDALRAKHRKYLDCMQWQRSPCSTKALFTVATHDNINKRVVDASGNDISAPHNMFVDADVYADVYDDTHQQVERLPRRASE